MDKLLLCATSVFALSAGTLSAQDLQHDWNGWYVGGQIGLSQHSATYEDVDYDWYGSTIDLLSLGGTAGVSLGYNTVTQNTLMGVQADIGVLSNSEETIYSSDVQIQNDLDVMAKLQGRVGHAVGDTVIYTSAGLAYANFERSWTEFNDVPDTWPDLGDGKVGVVLGFGLEQAINERLSVSGTFTSSLFGENTSVNPDGFPLRINDKVDELTFAVNYKLGDVSATGPAQPQAGSPANFAGAYGGARLGGAFADISTSDIGYYEWGGTYDIGNTGGLAAVSGGYNWQLGATVVGVEAQLAFADLSESYDNDFGTADTSMEQLASIRARAGMAVGDTMLYVLGGVTSAEVDNVNESDTSGTYTGLTVGAGVEQFITDRVSWTAEGTYTLFDGQDDSDSADEGFYGTADLTTVAAGVNYYFGEAGRSTGAGAMAPSHDWSGGYYGADLIMLANEGSVQDPDYYESGDSYDVVSLGAGVGGHVGYNWQNGAFVYGAVADIAAYSNEEAQTVTGYREVSSAITAMATLRGRAGIASGNTLLYTTAGLGFVQSELEHAYLPSPNTSSFDLSDTRVGAVVGLGVEHALSDTMSVKLETLYFTSAEGDYAQDPVQGCGGPSGFDGGDCEMVGTDSNLSIKAGLSFAF
ncbi:MULTISPECIES: outer membrane protein [Rhodobacterales]|uniref:outer membrane protein n=1 Tax=Rhodobacterales TaxID=204455 RepID=UPI0015F10F16|nr:MULTISPECIES: outer membrane beta-barrel protein [Rhodobacterales]MDO6592052.1 outer membrane beta-barrel protein [Yoonia sp. 1_MG-2023]